LLGLLFLLHPGARPSPELPPRSFTANRKKSYVFTH